MTRRPRRIILPCLIATAILACTLTPKATSANDADIDSIVAEDYEAELCGWGTHDSTPLEPETTCNYWQRRSHATRTSISFDESLATVAAAACAGAGVSIEQFVEPFAMVGPTVEKSLQSVQQFQNWWSAATAEAQAGDEADTAVSNIPSEDIGSGFQTSHVPVVDFDGEIPRASEIPGADPWPETLAAIEAQISQTFASPVDNASDFSDEPLAITFDSADVQQQLETLAAEEPVDASGFDTAAYGPSILLSDVPAGAATVGSSAMVFSMSEAYQPYDLAIRDLHAGGVLSMSKRPFCIRARVELPEFDLAFDRPDVPVAPAAAAGVERDADADSDFVVSGSADCVLDDWLWRASLALEEGGPVRKRLRPELAGQQIAALVVKHDQVARGIVDRLAALWPKADPPQPTAGALLLARAEALELSEQPQAGDAAFDAEQLAEVTAKLRDWVSAVETAASRWLPRLAQLPRNLTSLGPTSRR